MKKFLSLALALIMTMSLVTISASADFTDDDAITYSEAVDVMYALEVIGGYTDGSFDPTATLTRGAAAKIICNLTLGPTTADALVADAAPFPDVAVSHVFAPYIAYCASQGIVGGYADGNFYPSAEVTGYQFMKMLLGALGYSADYESYTGDNWSINVAKQALSVGLDDGNEDFLGSAAMTREEACLYALNTLTATMVEYTDNSSVTVGDIVITSSSSASEIANTTSNDGYIADDNLMQFAEKNFKTLKMTDGDNSFGQPTTTWYKSLTKIGTYINSDDQVAYFEGKVTNATMYDLIDEDAYVIMYCDGDDETGFTYDTDYGYDLFTKNSTEAANDSGNGALTYVYEVSDESYVIVTKNEYVVQATADYNTTNEYLRVDDVNDSGMNTVIYNDDVTVEDFEDDDYILVTVANGEIQSAVLAETMTGEVSSYYVDNYVYIDGSKYSYNKTIDADTSNGKSVAYEVGENTIVVMDTMGNIVYVDDVSIASDRYVFIDELDYSTSFSTPTIYAAAYFSDGTYAEIELDDVTLASDFVYDVATDTTKYTNAYTAAGYVSGTGDELTNRDAIEGLWFTYTTNTDGSYDLTMVEDKYTVGEDGYDQNMMIGNDVTNGVVNFAYDNDASANIKGNSDTVFVIVDDDGDVYTYTGVDSVPDVTGTIYTYALVNASNYASVVFIDASADDAYISGAGTSAADFMLVMNEESVDVYSSDYIVATYSVIMDGVEMEIEVDVDEYEELIVGAVYYDVKEDADGYITDADILYTDGYDEYEQNYSFDLADTAFDYSGNVLESDDTVDFLVSDTDIYVVVGAGNAYLLSDDNADYEINYFSSAKSTASFLDDVTVDGAMYVLTADEGNTTAEVIFIYVEDSEYVSDDYTSSDVDFSTDDYVVTKSGYALSVLVAAGADSDIDTLLAVVEDYLEENIGEITYAYADDTDYSFTVSGKTYSIDLNDAASDVTVGGRSIMVDGTAALLDPTTLISELAGLFDVDTTNGAGYKVTSSDADDAYKTYGNDKAITYVTNGSVFESGYIYVNVDGAAVVIYPAGSTIADLDANGNYVYDGTSKYYEVDDDDTELVNATNYTTGYFKVTASKFNAYANFTVTFGNNTLSDKDTDLYYTAEVNEDITITPASSQPDKTITVSIDGTEYSNIDYTGGTANMTIDIGGISDDAVIVITIVDTVV